jgi:hypothetical protein
MQGNFIKYNLTCSIYRCNLYSGWAANTEASLERLASLPAHLGAGVVSNVILRLSRCVVNNLHKQRNKSRSRSWQL